MHEIHELKEMLCDELEKYGAKGDLNAGELEIVDKLAHTVKNLGKIIEMYEDEEYSNADGMTRYNRGGNMSMNRGSYNRGGEYRGGSYARGRGRNARRDARGRYSSEGYSRTDEMEDMAESIRGMMGELPADVKRDAEKFVQKLEQNMM